MKELEAQKIFKELLLEQFKAHNQKVQILVGNEFRNVEKKKHLEKPDLVIFHKINFQHPIAKIPILPSPIGIEYKHSDHLDTITTGVVKQLQNRYLDKIYLNKETKQEFKLNSLAFANTNSVRDGLIYKRHYPEASNFFIERFCWKGNVAVILRTPKNGLVFSHRNYHYFLNGKYFRDGSW